jgi:hypothetical protein
MSSSRLFVPCRLQVDHESYCCLNTKDVTLLASALKLFLRELADPLISKEVLS